MSGRFVRSSKYRHVFGRPTRKEQCYDNLRISRNAWDSNLVKANPRYLSVNWEASGGGAFAVIPIEERGRLPDQLPLFRGHTAVVLDTDWSPFNDSLIVSGSDDGKAFVWHIPDDFRLRLSSDEDPQRQQQLDDVAPAQRLVGHSRKVGHVLFNPSAENILATSSGDCTIKIWDVEAGSAKLTLRHEDIVQGLSWSANGSLMVTTSRDKKLRVWDVRQESPVHVGPGHAGAKNSRVVWMGEHDRIATTGFSKMSDRQLGLWDLRNANEPLDGFERLDSISGVCMPFWDDGTQCLYLAGKGDGNIRYFEYQNDRFEFLSEYKSADPQRGVAFLPKRGVNVHENETMRAFKTVSDGYIEPISFIVPRRAEVFQDDIFPPTTGLKPGMSSQEWFAGHEVLPPKIDLAVVYAGEQVTNYIPSPSPLPDKTRSLKVSASSAASTAPSSPVTRTAKTPTANSGNISTKTSLPSMKQQTASIRNMTAQYQDPADSNEDDASSFEEIATPNARTTTSLETEPGEEVPASDSVPILSNKSVDQASHIAATQSTQSQIKAQADVSSQSQSQGNESMPISTSRTISSSSAQTYPVKSSQHSNPVTGHSSHSQPMTSASVPISSNQQTHAELNSPLPPSSSSSSSSISRPPTEVQRSLAEIKELLHQQQQAMLRQNDTISKLAQQVEILRAHVPGE